MTRAVADTISAALQAVGYDHTRFITGDEHRIVLQKDVFEGPDLLTMIGILVPGGTPLEGVAVRWSGSAELR